MLKTLYFKLSLALVVLFILIGTALVMITRFSSDMYYLEITQRLNASVAMYVADEAPLIRNARIDKQALQKLAHDAMVINPTVEVYLLGPNGSVLTHGLGEQTRVRERVDMGPVARFLSGSEDYPIKGDDPRSNTGKKIFSVAEIRSDGRLEGYVYVVLGGEKYEAQARFADAGRALTLSTAAVVACLVFGLGSALLIFSHLSWRLLRLSDKVNRYWFDSVDKGKSISRVCPKGDEVAQLDEAFGAMQKRIDIQMEQIRNTDHTRRELITNISHDLRTPLTSIQGYLETLLLKGDRIDEQQRKEYLTIAHNHGERLGRLVGDLFELARLDSNAVKPQLQSFSLAELVNDIAQEFRLSAEKKSISLVVRNDAGASQVCVDIHLIERVFSNLLENALRHTPEYGRIEILLRANGPGVRVTVADTGPGITDEDLPYIFDRLFHSAHDSDAKLKSSGLGLAIVKRILDLHNAVIQVRSQESVGTSFMFDLPNNPSKAAFS